MIKYVDYDNDIKDAFDDILRGAYNKANIWVKNDNDYVGFDILKEELEEVEQAYIGFKNYTEAKLSSEFLPVDVHGYVLSLMSELLQVLAVCNKYWPKVYGGESDD